MSHFTRGPRESIRSLTASLIFEGHVMASLTTHVSVLILLLSVSTTGWSQDLTNGGIPVGSQVEFDEVIIVVPETERSKIRTET